MKISVDLKNYSNDDRLKILKQFEDAGWARSAFSFEKPTVYTNDTDIKDIKYFIYHFVHTASNPVIPDSITFQVIE